MRDYASTFERGYNLNIAAVDVLNPGSIIKPQLLDKVRQTRVSLTQLASGEGMGIALFSNEERVYDENFISNDADWYSLDPDKAHQRRKRR